AKKAELLPQLLEQVNSSYEKLHMPLEKDLLVALLNLYVAKGGKDLIDPSIAEIASKNNGDFTSYLNKAFETSIFADKEKLVAFINNPDAAVLSNDLLFQLSTDILNRYRLESDELKAKEDDFNR